MQTDHVTLLGQTTYRNALKPFGIKQSDRRRHMYVIGQTGAGKSTLLLNMIAQDARNELGFALLDPHGDLVERVLDLIPPHRVNDTVYVNPADLEYPVAFNVLKNTQPELRHLAASGLVQVFKKIWSDSWGPRLEYVLRNAILALLECPGQTLLGIPRMLTDGRYRQWIIKHVTDPVVRNFWLLEYEQYPKVFRTETISPIQNKVGQFLSAAIMRNILGQTKTKFDLRQVMDNGQILLVNLAKGKVGEDNAALLGALIVTKLQLAAMSRAEIPEANRKPFSVFIDEFQSFATESFTDLLSEMRKYGIQLVLAHQYLAQLPDLLRSAVFGNVGTIITFRIGAEDGEYLEEEFTLVFTADDLLMLPAHHVYLKLSIDGTTSEPFSAVTFPPPTWSCGTRDKIIQQSRQRYSMPRSVVETKIAKWKSSELPFQS